MTQAERVLRWLRENPDSSHLEIGDALRIANVTARLSDLRKQGHQIDAQKDSAGVYRFRVVEQPQQLAWTA